MKYIIPLLLVFLIGCTTAVQTTQEQTKAVKLKVDGYDYKFTIDGQDNPTLRVKQGDVVEVEFTSVQGFHDFVIDELDAKTAKYRDGGSEVITFTASKKGSFEYYCSVGSHRANGMVGTLIVE